MSAKKNFDKKHKEDQEATAFAFQEFIQTFQSPSTSSYKTFVKSGVLFDKNGQESALQKGQLYNPQQYLKQTSSTIRSAIECARLLKETVPERTKGQEKRKSNLESLKEELKLRHMERGEKTKVKDNLTIHSPSGSSASNDPNTTNLFIANIKPKISEQHLMQLFGAFGPLASVKIMWPRCDDKNRSTNCGFVAFMSRSDAERSMKQLKDRDEMRISWGKPVELPQTPIYIPPQLLKLSVPPPYTGLPFNAQPLKVPFKHPTTDEEMQDLLYNSVVKVTIPLDKKVLMIVHRVIEFVIREGPLFEAMLMNREINNSMYQFLFDNRNPVHIYYRWKLYSILQKENQKNWSTKEFRMFKNGSIWRPPFIPDYSKGMPEHLITSSHKVDKSMLSEAQKSRFIQLLQTLDVTRKKIGEAMVFCLNHVDAVKDIVDITVDSFMSTSTRACKKVARLYLISDVLYNASMKKCYAPIYRTEFQSQLLNVFKQLHETLSVLNLINDKEHFKFKVLNVLKSWDLWKLYNNDYLVSLKNAFLGINIESCIDVESTDYVEPIEAINVSVKNDSDFIEKSPPKEKLRDSKKAMGDIQQLLPGFIPSKWETIDPEKVESQAMSTKKFYDMEVERQIREGINKPINEEIKTLQKPISAQDRDLLRKVEVMVMQYQDELESGKRKLKKGKHLEKEVDDYRNHLIKNIKKDNKKKRKPKNLSENESSSDEWEKETNARQKRKLSHTSRSKENKKVKLSFKY